MSTPLLCARFKVALNEEKPLHIIGAINANHALLAKRAGYRTNLAHIFDSPTQEKILALSLGYEALTATPVDEFMDLMAL